MDELPTPTVHPVVLIVPRSPRRLFTSITPAATDSEFTWSVIRDIISLSASAQGSSYNYRIEDSGDESVHEATPRATKAASDNHKTPSNSPSSGATSANLPTLCRGRKPPLPDEQRSAKEQRIDTTRVAVLIPAKPKQTEEQRKAQHPATRKAHTQKLHAQRKQERLRTMNRDLATVPKLRAALRMTLNEGGYRESGYVTVDGKLDEQQILASEGKWKECLKIWKRAVKMGIRDYGVVMNGGN